MFTYLAAAWPSISSDVESQRHCKRLERKKKGKKWKISLFSVRPHTTASNVSFILAVRLRSERSSIGNLCASDTSLSSSRIRAPSGEASGEHLEKLLLS